MPQMPQYQIATFDRETGEVKEISYDDFVKEIHEKIKDKPFSGLNASRHMTSRPQIMV